jgi:hypothetical protein
LDLSLSELRKDTTVGHDSVHPQFLAALLRLADELDTTWKRAPYELEDIIPESEESKREWRTHQLIWGVKIESDISLIELEPYSERILNEEDRILVYERHAKLERELQAMQVYLDSVDRQVYKLGYRRIEIRACTSLSREWFNEYRAERVLQERVGRIAKRSREREPITEPSVKQDISTVMDIDRDIGERIRAIDRLGKRGNFEASECLLQSLMDDDSEVRLASVNALGRIGDSDATKPLLDHLLVEEHPDVYNAIPGALSGTDEEGEQIRLRIEGPAVTESLLKAVQETTGDKFNAVVAIVSVVDDPERIQKALICLKSSLGDGEIRMSLSPNSVESEDIG